MRFYELMFWDSEADDRRGEFRGTGRFFRKKADADKEAARLTDEIVQKDMRQEEAAFNERRNRDRRIVQENNALVALGLRSKELPMPEQQFEYNALRLRWIDRYDVEEREFELE